MFIRQRGKCELAGHRPSRNCRTLENLRTPVGKAGSKIGEPPEQH